MLAYALPLLPPLLFAVAAVVSLTGPGFRPRVPQLFAEGVALAAILVSAACAVLLIKTGAGTSPLLGAFGVGLSARLDAVSVVMMLLVSFIGWIVVRYTGTYLDGEKRQGTLTGEICAVLASVLLVVTAGNLAQLVAGWIGTGLFLNRLLVFYPERAAAQAAMRKRRAFSRIGDAALILAAILLAATYGTSDIATILAAAKAAPLPAAGIAAAALVALAAILQSAQFPTHGWLTEVMETPTPVSATLHAGIINAGGFLLIRFADLMLGAPLVLAALVLVGSFTALFGALVMLTQPAVKTSLAWSTVAQMGFMIMQCGLTLNAIALLHIVAHSLYKAHAFLTSGTAVDVVAATRRPGPVAIPSARAVGRAFLIALAIYGVVGLAFGILEKPPQVVALGAILIFGVAYILAQGFADAAPRALTQWTAVYAVATTVAYFSLQWLADRLTSGVLPPPVAPDPLEWALIALAVMTFAGVAVAQAMFPLWAFHPAAAGFRVHLSNGLYANAVIDRLLGRWSLRTSS
ncbi:MAG: proton-conducting transporter membrane subunit [Hyphomicrobiales bacterium]